MRSLLVSSAPGKLARAGAELLWILCVSATHLVAGAGSAGALEEAPAFLEARVQGVERMSSDAMRLSHVLTADAVAAPMILSRRYSFKVVGVDASLVSAEVVEFQFVWDLSHEHLVEDPVSANLRLPPIPSEGAIAQRNVRSVPDPTSTISDRESDLGRDALEKLEAHRSIILGGGE